MVEAAPKCALWKTCYKFLILSLGNSEQALGITGIAAGWEVRFLLGRVICLQGRSVKERRAGNLVNGLKRLLESSKQRIIGDLGKCNGRDLTMRRWPER